MSTAMVPKIEKKRNGGKYARTKLNTMAPKPKKTPNMTEDLKEQSENMTRRCDHQLTQHPESHPERL
jgi:hypothetical protein